MAERWICRGGAGRPESAVTMGTLVIDRAGREAARYVATMATIMLGMITAHGRVKAPIRWWELDSACGRYSSHATRPNAAPKNVPTTPTTAPFAFTTSLMFRSVAPRAPSMPIERRRRCASTVKPPTATRAMRSIPTVATANTIVSGLKTLPDVAD